MLQFFADLHIHVGVTRKGSWIKIPTSRTLTVQNIIGESAYRKGMDIIGIVDALSPLVMDDIQDLVDDGRLSLQAGGGYRYLDRLTVLLGAEIETAEVNGGTSHSLVFLPDINSMTDFSKYMAGSHIKNINLSSQNAHMSIKRLIQIAGAYNAIVIPAHIFTPHKSLFGVSCHRLGQLLSEREIELIDAMELGLSADSDMADRIAELGRFSFVTNSDAHSLGKIAREYTVLQLHSPTFLNIREALRNKNGQLVTANYGLNPRLGKYHRTFCLICGSRTQLDSDYKCIKCGSSKVIKGVYDRVDRIADYSKPHHPSFRAPYFYQIPLEFIPGVGKKIKEKLLAVFGTEMNILHSASTKELTDVVGAKLAAVIDNARFGRSAIESGAGGTYGRLIKSKS